MVLHYISDSLRLGVRLKSFVAVACLIIFLINFIVLEVNSISQFFIVVPSGGSILDIQLTAKTSPNPSKVNQSITIFGDLANALGDPLPQQMVLIEYSNNLLSWESLSKVVTDEAGRFSSGWKPSQNGQLSIRVNACGKITVIKHLIVDYIIAQDDSGDFEDLTIGITALPKTGGTIYIKNGTYILGQHIQILGKSNVILVGSGYNTKIMKSSGLIFRIENVSNLIIKNLHFHHLANDNYEAISVKGFNDGIVIDTCWFTRDLGPPGKYIDLIFFDPTGATRNLQIKNSYFKNAQIDAMAIKKVQGGTIENNTILDAATNHPSGLGSGMTIEASFNITIVGNYIKRTGNQSMGGVNIFGGSKNICVQRNTVENVEWGVNICRASNISVCNNWIIDPFSSGVRVEEALNVSIKDNHIEQHEFDRNVPGIFAVRNYNTTILANIIRNLGSGIRVLHNERTTIGFNTIELGAQTFVLQRYGVQVYNSSNSKVNNNTILKVFDVGLSVSFSQNTIISGNIVAENQRSGVRLINSNNSIILENMLSNNGKDLLITFGRNGIDIVDSFNCTIKWNSAFDDKQPKTQLYGLVESGNSDYNSVVDNDFRWNALAAMKIVGPHTIAYGNLL